MNETGGIRVYILRMGQAYEWNQNKIGTYYHWRQTEGFKFKIFIHSQRGKGTLEKVRRL